MQFNQNAKGNLPSVSSWNRPFLGSLLGAYVKTGCPGNAFGALWWCPNTSKSPHLARTRVHSDLHESQALPTVAISRQEEPPFSSKNKLPFTQPSVFASTGWDPTTGWIHPKSLQRKTQLVCNADPLFINPRFIHTGPGVRGEIMNAPNSPRPRAGL